MKEGVIFAQTAHQVIPVGSSLKSDSTKVTNTCCDLKVLTSKDHLNGTLNSEVR